MADSKDAWTAFRGEAAEVYARLVGRRRGIPTNVIIPECNELAARCGTVRDGNVEFVEFPDGSRLAWTPEDGFIHPLNG